MISFLLDMGIAHSTAGFLRTQGYDVVHLTDQSLQRLPDEKIVDKAKDENRVIVTHDLDFGRIVALSGQTIPSIITLRLNDMTPGAVNAALEVVLRKATQSLHSGAFVTVTDTGSRIRILPVKTLSNEGKGKPQSDDEDA